MRYSVLPCTLTAVDHDITVPHSSVIFEVCPPAFLPGRFGAEDLFKAAEEGSAERSKRLLEEDIDQILERAEVVQQDGLGGRSSDGAAGDLLSSFNVATFKVCRGDTDRTPARVSLQGPRLLSQMPSLKLCGKNRTSIRTVHSCHGCSDNRAGVIQQVAWHTSH